MKAVVFYGKDDLRLEEVEKPKIIDPEDVILRVTTASICGSDLHRLHAPVNKPGTIFGHEFVGVVEEVGPAVTAVKVGDRVAASGMAFCGKCRACRENKVHSCKDMAIYGGRFGSVHGTQSEYARVLYANNTLEKIPDGLSDEQVFMVGDILSTAYTAVSGASANAPGVKPGDTVVIYGAGPVGLCSVAMAKLFGAGQIIVIDVEEYRLDKAVEMGADKVFNPLNGDSVQAVMQMTDGWGAEYVIEAVGGKQEVFNNAVYSAAPGGSVIFMGVYGKPVELPIDKLLSRNITVQIALATETEMNKLMKLIANGKLDLTPMITHTLPLADALKGYEIFDKKLDNCIKVLLKP